MTLWIVLGCVLLALVLISLIRVGALAEYGKAGVLAKLRLGPFSFTVYPVKQKKEKRKKKKEAEPKAGEEPDGKPGGSWAQLKEYLPLLTDGLGRLKRKIRVDKLFLDFTAAAADPAMAAMAFGGGNAALGMLLPLLEHNFNIKDRQIRTAVDFSAPGPTVYVCAVLSLTVGQAVSLAARLAVRFLKTSAKTPKTEKEAV